MKWNSLEFHRRKFAVVVILQEQNFAPYRSIFKILYYPTINWAHVTYGPEKYYSTKIILFGINVLVYVEHKEA